MKTDDSLVEEITRGKRVVLSKKDRKTRIEDGETRDEILRIWEQLYNDTRKRSQDTERL